MFKNWTNRDWFWLTGALIFIIILLLANYYLKWKTDFSIIASATSIALAIIAIFLSLKQDSDSKSTSESMRHDFTTQFANIMTLIASQKGEIDEVATSVNKSVDTNVEEKGENYTHEQLVEYGDKIKRETIEEFKKEMNEKVMSEAFSLSLKQVNEYRDLESNIREILITKPELDFHEVYNLLLRRGGNPSKSSVRNLINKYKSKA